MSIGLDASFVFRALDTRYGPKGTPDAIRTVSGWVLFGPAPCTTTIDSNIDTNLNMHVAMHENICDDVMSPDESICSSELQVPNSCEDSAAHKRMRESVRLIDGRFHLPLLWKHDNVKLPNARPMAESRLESLKKRLKKNKKLRFKYSEVMQSYIDKGYAEVVGSDTSHVSERDWFLPHHPVGNPRKPDKLRIVFDCAARHMGVSPKDVLLQSPKLMNSLVGVLTRFRSEPIALVADIESMFHQVKVNPEDRDSLKFPWWTN